jgi:hypothetical protein
MTVRSDRIPPLGIGDAGRMRGLAEQPLPPRAWEKRNQEQDIEITLFSIKKTAG